MTTAVETLHALALGYDRAAKATTGEHRRSLRQDAAQLRFAAALVENTTYDTATAWAIADAATARLDHEQTHRRTH